MTDLCELRTPLELPLETIAVKSNRQLSSDPIVKKSRRGRRSHNRTALPEIVNINMFLAFGCHFQRMPDHQLIKNPSDTVPAKINAVLDIWRSIAAFKIRRIDFRLKNAIATQKKVYQTFRDVWNDFCLRVSDWKLPCESFRRQENNAFQVRYQY